MSAVMLDVSCILEIRRLIGQLR